VALFSGALRDRGTATRRKARGKTTLPKRHTKRRGVGAASEPSYGAPDGGETATGGGTTCTPKVLLPLMLRAWDASRNEIQTVYVWCGHARMRVSWKKSWTMSS